MLFRTKLVAVFATGLIVSTSAMSAAVDIGFDVNFFGNTYSQLYVHDNGSISFSNGDADYTFSSLPNTKFAPDPFIAPFIFNPDTFDYSDVTLSNYFGDNTLSVAWVTYTGYEIFYYDIAGDGYMHGVLWTYYESFSLTLVDRSDIKDGDFDFIFTFEEPLAWFSTHGTFEQGWTGALDQGASFFGYGAQGNLYGYSTDDNHLLTLNSGQLIYNSLNSDVAGRYVFEVRDGVVTNPLPLLAVPEPETYVMLLAGLGVVGAVARRRRITAIM